MARPGTRSRKVSAPAVAGTRSRLVGSGITQASARQPRSSSPKVPNPPSSSPCTQARSRSPRSRIPLRRRATSAQYDAARPAFMSQAPRPCRVSPTISPENGRLPVQVSRLPAGTTSTWAFNISDRAGFPSHSSSLPAHRPTSPHDSARSTSTPGKSARSVRSARGSCQWSTSRPSPASCGARAAWRSFSSGVPPTLGQRTSSANQGTSSSARSSTAATTSSRSAIR